MAGLCSRNVGSSVIGSVKGKVFSVMGPKHFQIDSLGMLSSNDPVKNGRKEFTENCFRSVLCVVTMVPLLIQEWQHRNAAEPWALMDARGNAHS